MLLQYEPESYAGGCLVLLAGLTIPERSLVRNETTDCTLDIRPIVDPGYPNSLGGSMTILDESRQGSQECERGSTEA